MLKQISILALLSLASLQAKAQCDTPLTTLNENFQTFQEDSFPQQCWTSSTTQSSVTDWYEDDNLAALLLVGPGAQNPSYLVSPLVDFNEQHTLSFNASGRGTIQVGLMASATDFSSFTPLESFNVFGNRMQYHFTPPVFAAPKHLVFRLIPVTITSHVVLDDIMWPSPLNCEEAVDSFYEDFSSFELGSVSQHCWAGNQEETYLSISGTTRFVMMYCEPTENVNELYLVSPRISDLTGSHTLSFRATGADGLYQPGTMISPFDFGSFVPYGEPVLTVAGLTDFEVPLSGPESHHYVALKFTVAPGSESSVSMLRRIALDQELSTPSFGKSTVAIYPNPVSTILNIATEEGITGASVFDMGGRLVLSSGNSLSIDVSKLTAGVYVLALENNGDSKNFRFVKE